MKDLDEPRTATEAMLSLPEPAWSRMHRARNRLLAAGMEARDAFIRSMLGPEPIKAGKFEFPIAVDPDLPAGTIELRYGDRVVGRIENIGAGYG